MSRTLCQKSHTVTADLQPPVHHELRRRAEAAAILLVLSFPSFQAFKIKLVGFWPFFSKERFLPFELSIFRPTFRAKLEQVSEKNTASSKEQALS